MIEKLARGFGEVVEGKKSWRIFLGGLLDGGGDLGGGSSRRR
jgi:hypothetical protein